MNFLLTFLLGHINFAKELLLTVRHCMANLSRV